MDKTNRFEAEQRLGINGVPRAEVRDRYQGRPYEDGPSNSGRTVG
jgi:hypothetical protein